jgi:alpha-aminoadipic semialdehyde synthase
VVVQAGVDDLPHLIRVTIVNNCIGIRRETIDETERRAPLTPAQVERLVEDYGVSVVVEPSPLRVFPDAEYAAAGATLSDDLLHCNVVFGVKEIPIERIRAGGAYCYFSHTIKAQRYNMPMLAHIVEVGATLIDYELVTSESGKRLIFFGDFAGYAGMIDTLWALGRRLEWEGLTTPFADLEPAWRYRSLADAETALVEVGQRIQREGLPAEITPLVCLFTGRGRVSKGAQRIFGRLPAVRLQPEEIVSFVQSGKWSERAVYGAELVKRDLYRAVSAEALNAPGEFDPSDFSTAPEHYAERLTEYLDCATLLVNGIFWSPRFPRLITREYARRRWSGGDQPRLRVIGDITCDVGGSIELTVKATDATNPVFVYEPVADTVVDGWAGDGPVILAVDKLPAELPREASQSFGEGLAPFIPTLARADFSADLESLDIPLSLRRAVIAHRGELTGNFRYLNNDLLHDES